MKGTDVMIDFLSDYSQGAHAKVLEALVNTNGEHNTGYGLDVHCEKAADIIRDLCKNDDLRVYMMVGGTPCNITVIAAALRPYQSVIALRTGHCYVHETGGVEATGHRVVTVEGVNGKINPDLIDKAFEEFEDEHTPEPGMVYISQPTECGSVYCKAELKAIFDKCRERGIFLYVDGARLGTALTCEGNDVTLEDLAHFCDAFYIGGTKNGALFGEALVFSNHLMDDHFRFMMKRQCGMLAKGWLTGVQFETLLSGGENSIYYEIARHENALAKVIRDGLKSLDIEFYGDSPTNQVFPILPAEVVRELRKEFVFHDWSPERDGKMTVRFVTGFGTTREEADRLVARIKELMG